MCADIDDVVVIGLNQSIALGCRRQRRDDKRAEGRESGVEEIHGNDVYR